MRSHSPRAAGSGYFDAQEEQVPSDSYVLVEPIARGGFGEVWKAQDVQLGRMVAVKLFDPQTVEISSALQHAKALARAVHPNVVTVHEHCGLVHPEDGDPREAVVMELVEGRTLCDFLSTTRLELPRARALLEGICAGLGAIHEKGAVHGDLHDENVMVTHSGEAKIIDLLERFSLRLAATVRREQMLAADMRALKTIFGAVLEQTNGVSLAVGRAFQERIRSVDGVADVWSLFVDQFGTEVPDGPSHPLPERELVERVKVLVAEPSMRIRLSDLIDSEIRAVLEVLSTEEFNVSAHADGPLIEGRVDRYDQLFDRLLVITVIAARWGDGEVENHLVRLAWHLSPKRSGGTVVWLNLAWYPLHLLSVAIGVACLIRGNLRPWRRMLEVPTGYDGVTTLEQVHASAAEVDRMGGWRCLPGLEQKRVALSEHLYTRLRPVLQHLLFPGDLDYEFDRAEVLMALRNAWVRKGKGKTVWGLAGRYTYKHHSQFDLGPFASLKSEAAAADETWAPCRDRFLGTSPKEVLDLCEEFERSVLAHARW